MRIAIVIAAACLLAVGAPDAQKAPAVKVVFLAREGARWCAFTDRGKWSEAVRKFQSDAGSIAFSLDMVRSMEYIQPAESGDWIVFDDYAFNDGFSDPVRLSREINFAEGDRRVRQVFALKAGRSALIRATVIDDQGQPVAGALPDWLPDPPIITKVADFPFHDLIFDPRAREAEMTCEPD